MSGMPLARIFASSVEEAEPLRADLLARGYNVEVVFPDAEPSGPADLELRLERCSPAQAVARVEADSGSPSRCVFLTPTKGPQRDLLLIEMTVAATGTHSRHPLYLPVTLPVANLVAIPQVEAPTEKQTDNPAPAKAVVLPFPENIAAAASVAPTSDDGQPSKNPVKKNDDDWDKLVGAEVTAFLAHAPQLEPVSFAGMLSEIGRSQIATRVRNRWEGLTLFGVASSVLLLLYVGWHAGPTHPPRPSLRIAQAAASTPSPAVRPSVPVAVQYIENTRLSQIPAAHFAPVRQSLVDTSRVRESSRRTSRVRQPRKSDRGDYLVAPDTIIRVRQAARRASISRPLPAADKVLISRTANPTKPVGISSPLVSSARNRQVPIKKISDLK